MKARRRMLISLLPSPALTVLCTVPVQYIIPQKKQKQVNVSMLLPMFGVSVIYFTYLVGFLSLIGHHSQDV